MLLETYLKNNNTNIRQMHIVSGIPETTVRGINKRDFSKWSVTHFDAIARTVGKERHVVMQELEALKEQGDSQEVEREIALTKKRIQRLTDKISALNIPDVPKKADKKTGDDDILSFI